MKPLDLFKAALGIIAILSLSTCKGQTNDSTSKTETQTSSSDMEELVGGPFENSEYLFIDMPTNIKASDTSPGWSQPGQKLLITGTIYKLDGKIPAPNVIMYYYHTDRDGYYSSTKNTSSKASKHGDIRGWVKSDSNGNYSIFTVRPAAYPSSLEPAHIHPSILEPNIGNPYYIHAFVFEDDPLLTDAKRENMPSRGGSGILSFVKQGDLQVAKHDIILGLNIPNYPE